MSLPRKSVDTTIGGIVLRVAGAASPERNAQQRRRFRLALRPQTTIDDWQRSIPSVSFVSLAEVLPLIALGLDVPQHFLRPDDSFDRELSLKDRFWCFVLDDDSRESIADEFDMRYGIRPSGEWADLRDVVLETCALTGP